MIMSTLDIRERIRKIWLTLEVSQRWELFAELRDEDAQEVFLDLAPADQAELLTRLDDSRCSSLLSGLPPDDLVDLTQAAPEDERARLLGLLNDSARKETLQLQSFAPDVAGGLMTPRFLSLPPETRVERALEMVRGSAKTQVETLSTLYVTDPNGRLLGVLALRELLSGGDGELVEDLMERECLSVDSATDREALGRLFSDRKLTSLPVLDKQGILQGIVTFDDVAEAVEEEVTEDMQKMGGLEVLDAPYLRIPLSQLIKKRAGWLSALFLGEMLTATAMSHYEGEIAKAVILAVFIPLIISSGGNSGSQASTLIIRAMALDEVRLEDWPRVAWRELQSGLCLGAILGVIGLCRILLWQQIFGTYGTRAGEIAMTVGASLVGVVLFGTLSGSMLPFLLRKVGFDPASASAPFVATLVDVTGLVIYFSVAALIMGGLS